ncbi:hypothetical protein GCM10027596_06430 [Nocardioides korecus]
MPLPAILIFCVWGLLAVAAVLVVLRARARKQRGQDAVESRGWTPLPEATPLVAGWDGWPFAAAREPGRASDAVAGELQGCRFMAFTWHQREMSAQGSVADGTERYSVVALATEQSYPLLSAVRGRSKMHRGHQHPGLTEVELGDPGFERHWRALGDPDFVRGVLTPEVRAELERVGESVSVQPGWVVRVVWPWAFFAGEDRMVEELQKLAAPFRAVPAATWAAYGGAPRFVGVLGHLPQDG